MTVLRLPRPDSSVAETLAQRMDRVRAEAAEIAAAHTGDFQDIVAQTLRYADDISGGGESYHVGVRELARSLAIDLRETLLALEVLRGRPQESPVAATRRAAAS